MYLFGCKVHKDVYLKLLPLLSWDNSSNSRIKLEKLIVITSYLQYVKKSIAYRRLSRLVTAKYSSLMLLSIYTITSIIAMFGREIITKRSSALFWIINCLLASF